MEVNLLAVLVAAIASMVLGFVWYGPLFGKMWMELMKFSDADMKKAKEKGMGKSYALMAVSSLITAYVVGLLLMMTGAADLNSALQLGAWIWLGFVATTSFSGVLWEGKPHKLWVLNNAYSIVNLLVVAAIMQSM